MRILSIFLILAYLTLITGCSDIITSYDYDTRADFANLRTFAWLPIPPASQVDDLTTRRIQRAISSQLGIKGINEVQDDPDFLIAMHTGRQSKVQIVDWGYSYPRYGRYWDGPSVDVYEYEEGTLVLDFVDTKTNELSWRGSASAVINPDLTPQEREIRINEAVSKILENFPPGL